MSEEQIRKAVDEAYKAAAPNAYFGNGFRAGMKFAENSKWINVWEKMPEPGEDVLTFNSHNKDQAVLFVWDGRFCDNSGSHHNYPEGRITHWMPLPAPPTE